MGSQPAEVNTRDDDVRVLRGEGDYKDLPIAEQGLTRYQFYLTNTGK